MNNRIIERSVVKHMVLGQIDSHKVTLLTSAATVFACGVEHSLQGDPLTCVISELPPSAFILSVWTTFIDMLQISTSMPFKLTTNMVAKY